jgi:hypothetical protein
LASSPQQLRSHSRSPKCYPATKGSLKSDLCMRNIISEDLRDKDWQRRLAHFSAGERCNRSRQNSSERGGFWSAYFPLRRAFLDCGVNLLPDCA